MRIVFESGITAASVSAIFLNLVFNILGSKEPQTAHTAARTPGPGERA